jgi:hypothetical protein
MRIYVDAKRTFIRAEALIREHAWWWFVGSDGVGGSGGQVGRALRGAERSAGRMQVMSAGGCAYDPRYDPRLHWLACAGSVVEQKNITQVTAKLLYNRSLSSTSP